jgi:hypothetical protein
LFLLTRMNFNSLRHLKPAWPSSGFCCAECEEQCCIPKLRVGSCQGNRRHSLHGRRSVNMGRCRRCCQDDGAPVHCLHRQGRSCMRKLVQLMML